MRYAGSNVSIHCRSILRLLVQSGEVTSREFGKPSRHSFRLGEKLLEQMAHTARIVSRQEYFNAVHFVMQNARNSIKGSITGSVPSTTEEKDRAQAIIDHISTAKMRGVSIQYILPKSPDRLVVANQYRQAGADMRLHGGIIVSDLRYTVIDSAYTVLGLPSSAGENQPTREGYVIPSEGLAGLFLRQFEARW